MDASEIPHAERRYKAAVLTLLNPEMDYQDIAAEVGVDPRTFRRWRKDDSWALFIRRAESGPLLSELRQEVLRTLLSAVKGEDRDQVTARWLAERLDPEENFKPPERRQEIDVKDERTDADDAVRQLNEAFRRLLEGDDEEEEDVIEVEAEEVTNESELLPGVEDAE